MQGSGADGGRPEYLTARELAELLRVRERKVYELAAAGDVPCSRATGKLLFRRAAVDAWLARVSSGPECTDERSRAAVFAGSHDPLLEWALRESGAELATYFDGSLDGIERFAARAAIASALHVIAPDPGGTASARGEEALWNVPLVRERFAAEPIVLMAFARRERGWVVERGAEPPPSDLAYLCGRRLVPRQPGAGSQVLLERLLERAGIESSEFERVSRARTESEAVLAVAEGRADLAFGLPSLAAQFGLDFAPLASERFDLLVERRAWFDPPLQRFVAFCRSAAFEERAKALPGYDTSAFGAVRFNGRT